MQPATITKVSISRMIARICNPDFFIRQISDLTAILAKANKGTPVFKKYERLDEEQAPEEETDSYDNYLAPMGGPAEPTLLYFYHPDHLGTSTFLTDGQRALYQFYLNLPFGETMTEQHSLTEDYETPFKFNGKELDEETGNYYYGARYYDPKWSIWTSVDPLAEKYPNISSYAYCANNPIIYIDPDGRDVVIWYKDELGREQSYVYKYQADRNFSTLPSSSAFLANSVKTLDKLIATRSFEGIEVNGKHYDGDRLLDIVNTPSDKNYSNTLSFTEQKNKAVNPSGHNPLTYVGAGKSSANGLGTVFFNDEYGISFMGEDGKRKTNSPTSQAAHEILHTIHANENFDQYKDRKRPELYVPGQGTPEEQQTVKETNVINGKLGEPTRPDYRGDNIKMKDPTINQP